VGTKEEEERVKDTILRLLRFI